MKGLDNQLYVTLLISLQYCSDTPGHRCNKMAANCKTFILFIICLGQLDQLDRITTNSPILS